MDSQLSLFNGIGQTQAEKKIFDLIGGRMNRQDKGRDSVSCCWLPVVTVTNEASKESASYGVLPIFVLQFTSPFILFL